MIETPLHEGVRPFEAAAGPVGHGLDVAAVFRALVDHGRLRASLQSTTRTPLSGRLLDRLAVFACLHGCSQIPAVSATAEPASNGEAAPGQPGTAAPVSTPESRQDTGPPAAWLRVTESMQRWFAGGLPAAQALLLASTSTRAHGAATSAAVASHPLWGDGWQPGEPPAARDTLIEFASAVRTAWPTAFADGGALLVTTAEFLHRFRGQLMLADAIVAFSQHFPSGARTSEERGCQAKHALQSMGLQPPPRGRRQPFVSTFGHPPNALQEALAQHLVPSDDTRVLLLESDTGSGKTAAALAWFLRLYERRLVDGLFYAVPERACPQAVRAQVQGCIERAFDDPAARPAPIWPPVHAGVPVGSAANGPTRHPDGPDIAALAAPVVVGTMDQALCAVSQDPLAPMHAASLDRQLLVVDEVSASDPRAHAALRNLVDSHVSHGGWAVLMSAALGESASARLLGHRNHPLALAAARPYPAVTTRHREIAIASGQPGITVELQWLATDDEAKLLQCLAAAIEAEARLFVVCNTEARARRWVDAARRHPVLAPHLLHAEDGGCSCDSGGPSRGNAAPFPPGTLCHRASHPAGNRPLLVIGAQRLEHCLDLDADALVSDLCPMDVLLQRAGRLHRQRGSRRPAGFERPRLWVLAPPAADSEPAPEPSAQPEHPDLGAWVAEGRVLQRTMDVLRALPELSLPEQHRWLVEQATHPDALASLGPAPQPTWSGLSRPA